jgi:hypothetical protein
VTTPESNGGPVKVFAFIKRRQGMTAGEFHRHWEDHHARFIADTPELARHLRGYRLYHRLAADEGRERASIEVPDAGFDGVMVQSFDSLAEFQALRDEPALQEFSAADAPRWRDPYVAMVVTRAADVIVGPAGGAPDAGMSMICILRRAPGTALEEFHEHWLRHHGGLFQTIPELRAPLLGYEQNHGLDLPGAEFDGVTQQWFLSLDAWAESLAVPAHAEIVEPDVMSFLDPSAIHFVIAGPPTVVV